MKNFIQKLFAKKATSSKKTSNMPVLLDFSQKELRELLAAAERVQVSKLLRSLKGQQVAYLNSDGGAYTELLKAKEPASLVDVRLVLGQKADDEDIQSSGVKEASLVLRSSLEALPFSPDSFDFILMTSSLSWKGNLMRVIPELAAMAKPGAQVVLTCIHPCFEFLHQPKFGYQRSVEDLFQSFKQSQFQVEDLHETSLQDALKFVRFDAKRMQHLLKLKRVPLILSLQAQLKVA